MWLIGGDTEEIVLRWFVVKRPTKCLLSSVSLQSPRPTYSEEGEPYWNT